MSHKTNPNNLKEIIKARSTPDENGCWIWNRAKNSKGYGQIWHSGKSHLAHRESYETFKGSAEGFLVCHKCDVHACVNPDHLFKGTHTDNLVDSYQKARRGIILAAEQIEEMKSLSRQGVARAEIGNALGLKKSAVQCMAKRNFQMAYVPK